MDRLLMVKNLGAECLRTGGTGRIDSPEVTADSGKLNFDAMRRSAHGD